MLLVFSGLGLAFTPPIAEALVDLAGGGEGDWDPRRAELVRFTEIVDVRGGDGIGGSGGDEGLEGRMVWMDRRWM